MTLYKRGNVFWIEFIIDKKKYRFSCKTGDKDVAGEVGAVIHADLIRNRFNLPAKFKAERLFGDIWQEYITVSG